MGLVRKHKIAKIVKSDDGVKMMILNPRYFKSSLLDINHSFVKCGESVSKLNLC